MKYAALLALSLTTTSAAADTLVVCPGEFRPALVEWVAHRQAQGHEILIVEPHDGAAELREAIRNAARSTRLKYLVLMGDAAELHEGNLGRGSAAAARPNATGRAPVRVPTNYLPANVNTRWGSEPTIASDLPYADLDGDGAADLATGRIPADSAAELRAYLRKVIRYEREAVAGDWERRLNVVSGAGGFGAVADAIIEAAGRQVIQQTVPATYDVVHQPVPPAARAGLAQAAVAHSRRVPRNGDIRVEVCERFRAGSLAWVYLGHGLPLELDLVGTAQGPKPLLSVDDVAHWRCGTQNPLAVLVACYTGAFDAANDCLAEKLALAEEGPVAVIAATRVSMPYGNTVLGYELLRACFQEEPRPRALGDALLLAQSCTLQNAPGDPTRASLDAIARGISPPPFDLLAERTEHVQMYHLLGDPLLRLRFPAFETPESVRGSAAE